MIEEAKHRAVCGIPSLGCGNVSYCLTAGISDAFWSLVRDNKQHSECQSSLYEEAVCIQVKDTQPWSSLDRVWTPLLYWWIDDLQTLMMSSSYVDLSSSSRLPKLGHVPKVATTIFHSQFFGIPVIFSIAFSVAIGKRGCTGFTFTTHASRLNQISCLFV